MFSNKLISGLSPKHSGRLSQEGNLLFLIRLCNLMEKYRTPLFGVNRKTSEPYAMEANSMTLVLERATIMLQISTSAGIISQYPSQVFNPSLMADNCLTLLAAEPTQVPQADRVVVRNEKEVPLEAPL